MIQRKLEAGDFVVPGDVLGVEEEFMPGENAYVDAGIVYSSATGKVQFDPRSRRVSVFPTSRLPPIPIRGDTVLGRICFMRGQFAHMEIVAIEGEKTLQDVLKSKAVDDISRMKYLPKAEFDKKLIREANRGISIKGTAG